jgi:hypothetical protein
MEDQGIAVLQGYHYSSTIYRILISNTIEPLYMQGPNPLGPNSILSLYLGPVCILYENSLAVIDIIEDKQQQQDYQDPLSVFMYALKGIHSNWL